MGHELLAGEEKLRGNSIRAAKERAPARRGKFKVLKPASEGDPSKAIAHTRRALTWKMVENKKDVKARLVANGYQDPDLTNGFAETSGSGSLRALKERGKRSLDIGNAFLRADGFQRDIFLLAPAEWDPSGANRNRKLHGPTYGLNGASASFEKTLELYLLRPDDSPAFLGLKFQVSTIGPHFYCFPR